MLPLITLLLLAAALYAQHRMAFHTATRERAVLARVVLAAVGVAFGFVAASLYASTRAQVALVFLSGFGLVHLPAAAILLLKRARGEPRS